MADSNLPKGWENRSNNIRPWTKPDNSSAPKPQFKPAKEVEQSKPENNQAFKQSKPENNQDANQSKPENNQADNQAIDSVESGADVVSLKTELPLGENRTTAKKEPKKIRVSTIVLAILLSVSLCSLAIFAFLYFLGSGKESNAEEQQIPVTAQTSEHTEVTTQKPTEETLSTELPTVKETAVPTTVEKATESENNDDNGSDFESYLVDVINEVYYYEEPDYTSKITGQFTELTTYTVVDETYDETGTHWGKLKSGAGWFNITEATDEYYTQRLSAAGRSFMQSSDMEYKRVGDVTFNYCPVLPVDQHTPVEDGYYKKIDSLSAEYVGDKTYTLHITGEYQHYNDVQMQLCCSDIDICFHSLNNYNIGEPFLNEKFEIDTTIHVSNNTSMVYIEFNFV